MRSSLPRSAAFAAAATLFLSAAAAGQTRASTDYQKAVQEAVSAKRAGQTAEQASLTIRNIVRIPDTDVLSAIREAGYRAEEAAEVVIRVMALQTVNGTKTMLGAGYPASDVVRVYRGVSKAGDEIVTGFREAGKTAAETISALETVGFITETTVRAVDATYKIGAGMMAMQLKGTGLTAVAVGQSLAAAGYKASEIGSALKAAGYDVIEIAASLKAIGLDIAATAIELKNLGYEMNEMAAALVQAHGMLAVPLAIALKGAGGSVAQIAEALLHSGLSLQKTAEGLRGAGYSAVAVGSVLIGLGETQAAVGEAMIAAGFSAVELGEAFAASGMSADQGAAVMRAIGIHNAEVAMALKQAWHQSSAAAAKAMRLAGYSAAQVLDALHASFQLSVQLAFKDVVAEYGLEPAVAAAEAAGAALKDVAVWAKPHATNVAEQVTALKNAFNAPAADVLEALVLAGNPVGALMQAMQPIYNLGTVDLANMFKIYTSTATQLAQLLVDNTSVTMQQALEIVAQIQF
jgi:hypothetical protein